MNEHTPSPWKVYATFNEEVFTLLNEDTLVAKVTPLGETINQCKANLSLIAAAPDLLEALNKAAQHIEAMMAHIEHKPERFKQHCWQQVLDARATIGKATGAT